MSDGCDTRFRLLSLWARKHCTPLLGFCLLTRSSVNPSSPCNAAFLLSCPSYYLPGSGPGAGRAWVSGELPGTIIFFLAIRLPYTLWPRKGLYTQPLSHSKQSSCINTPLLQRTHHLDILEGTHIALLPPPDQIGILLGTKDNPIEFSSISVSYSPYNPPISHPGFTFILMCCAWMKGEIPGKAIVLESRSCCHTPD